MKFNNFVGISNNIKSIIKMSAIAIALAYFIFHAVSGENGLVSYVRTKKLVSVQEEKLLKISEELESLKRNTELLSDKTLDLDILEERCRIILNYSEHGDKIVRTKSIMGF